MREVESGPTLAQSGNQPDPQAVFCKAVAGHRPPAVKSISAVCQVSSAV